ncbi:MAG: M23 family metallopeptidase [Lachnospiraceae bacterium]|nr:M23 family metallopeptidase [Lachnospiraceae bacterium]
MERVLTADERLRRAEEIYYARRKGEASKKSSTTVTVGRPKNVYVLRKMIIQITICFLIYSGYYFVQTGNFAFSESVKNTTNNVLTYDVNLQNLYNQVMGFINTNVIKPSEEPVNEEEVVPPSEATDSADEVISNTANLAATDVLMELGELPVETAESSITEIETDADYIKGNYSVIVPVRGVVSSRFGEREKEITEMSTYHEGIDIAANTGTEIVASISGEVTEAGEISGYGLYVKIVSNEITTIYAHCSKLLVTQGETVAQGQKIAEVGSTGVSTGPHLHFEIRRDGRNIDPELILGRM